MSSGYFKGAFNGSTSQYYRTVGTLANRPSSAQTIVDYVSFSSSTTPISYSFVNTSAFTETEQSGSVASAVQNFPSAATLYLINEPNETDTGQLAEVLFFTKELTSTERGDLFAYLKNKWGLRY